MRTKAPKSTCIGYANGGLLIACASPSLPVGRGGRCSRCDQLHRRGTLARADQFASINDVELPGEVKHAAMLREALPPPVAQPAPTTLFAMFDAPVIGPAPYSQPAPAPEPEPEPVAVKPWSKEWPACLLCDRTDRRHNSFGICTTCAIRSKSWRHRGAGVTLVWLPFDARGYYSIPAAQPWVTVRDLAEAAIYLERRAAAGGIPTGGKVIIRATKDADRLPERVIRPVAA